MDLKHRHLETATQAGIITPRQAEQLWAFWQQASEQVPSFQLTHVLYYFGGLLAISAISLFVTTAWDTLRGAPLLILSSLLFLLGFLLTQYFTGKKLLIPAGIMAVFSLAVVPLSMYNLQAWLGYLPASYDYAEFHQWVSWYWVPMELVTLVVSGVMLYFYRFPFLLFPLSIILWYMSMDLWGLLLHHSVMDFSNRAMFSLYFGLGIILAALLVDLKRSDTQKDYAFWLYIFGVLTFWGGLSAQDSHSELGKFLYCCMNVVMIFVSVFLNRRVFAVCGAIGILGYLGHLARSVFENSLMFPIVLMFLGLAIVFMGVYWARWENKLLQYFKPYMPDKILKRIRSS